MLDALIHNTGLFIYEHYSIALLAVNASMFLFGLLRMFPVNVRDDEVTQEHVKALLRKLAWAAVVGTNIILVAYAFQYGIKGELSRELLPSNYAYVAFLISYAIGRFFSLLYLRLVIPRLHSLRERFKVSQTQDAISDVRAEVGEALETENYNPLKYIKSADKKPLYFLGLNEKGKPLYSTEDEWKNNNKIGIGPTGSGKGVDIGVDVYQSILGGNCTIMIDPKPDKHIRSIMIDACKETNRKLIEIDLTGTTKSEAYALLASGSVREKRIRLQRMFKLEDKGDSADFYKVAERAKLIELLKKSPTSFKGLYKSILEYSEAKQDKSVLKGTKERAAEIAEIDAIQDDGINVKQAILDNACVYVRCSVSDRTVITLATAFLEDCVQSLFSTSLDLGGKRKHHVYINVDELRFIINPFIADSLATLKATNAHMGVSFQSIEDLKNIPDTSVDKESLSLSIKVNCTHKLLYRADDDIQAEWSSKQTATVNKLVIDRAKVELNSGGAEEFTGERSLNMQEEAFISPNAFMMLNERVGVMLRPAKLASVIRTAWIPTDLRTNIPDKNDGSRVCVADLVEKEINQEKADRADNAINHTEGQSGNRKAENVQTIKPIVKAELSAKADQDEKVVEKEKPNTKDTPVAKKKRVTKVKSKIKKKESLEKKIQDKEIEISAGAKKIEGIFSKSE